MILIEPMKYALELTKMFNGLSEEQLAFFMKKKYPERNPNKDIDRMHRMKLIKICDNAVCIPRLKTEPCVREAVEIMQLFWTKYTFGISGVKHPILAKFSKPIKGIMHDYCICKSDNVLDSVDFSADTTVIVITDFGDKQKTEFMLKNHFVQTGCNFLLAVKEYGKYYFYRLKDLED